MAYKSHIQTYPERIERAADILVSALCSRVIDFYKSENRTINQTVNIQPSVTASIAFIKYLDYHQRQEA